MNILKNIFKKNHKIYTPEAQGDALLCSARIIAKNEMENHRDRLRQMGFVIFDTSTQMELIIFYYYFEMKAVEKSPIPSSLKKKIKDAMFKSFFLWIKSSGNDENAINDFISLMRQRLIIYQTAQNMTEEAVRNNQDMLSLMINLVKVLIEVWRRYLKENLDPENNILDLLPSLATFFLDNEMALMPIFIDEICKMNLSEEEYQKRKEFLERIEKKSETEEGRRDIEKGLKAVEEYRKRQGNIR